MNKWQAMVHEFHEATNSAIGTDPGLRENELRAKLILEEAVETVAAMGYHVYAEVNDPTCSPRREIATFEKMFHKPSILDVIDGLCDLLYVTVGTAVTGGFDLDPFFRAVHTANMKKLEGPKRDDGKQLKPEGWTPPDHELILIQQAREAERWKELEAKVLGTG